MPWAALQTLFQSAEAGGSAVSFGYSRIEEFVKLSDRVDSFLSIMAPREPRDPVANPIVFTHHSGNCWKFTYPFNSDEYWYIWEVLQNGVSLTPVSSIANCIATLGSWFFDLETERAGYLTCTNGEDPNAELIQVAPVFAFATHRAFGSEFAPIFDLSVIKAINAPWQVFECRLSENGLGEISHSLDSAYHGISVPSLSKAEIINGQILHNQIYGRMDTYPDRFQFDGAPFLVWYGDAGAILGLDEHLFLDEYLIIHTPTVDDEMFSLEFDTSAALLDKYLPEESYDNDEGNQVAYKNIFYGLVNRIPATRIADDVWSWSGHASDGVVRVFNGEETVDESDYELDLSQSKVTFTGSLGDDPEIFVTAWRNVDLDGNNGAPEQYPGAMIRHLMRTYLKRPIAELPIASFQTLDAYKIVVSRLIGPSQVLAGDELAYWLKSISTWMRKAAGIWELYRYNSSNLRGVSANVEEYEILKISKTPERNEINNQALVFYDCARPSEDEWKVAKVEHPSAGVLYPSSKPHEIKPTILKNAVDAEALGALELSVRGQANRDVLAHATGEILRPYAGDIINLNRLRGFDSSGSWVDKKFIIRDIKKRLMGERGTAVLELTDPAVDTISGIMIGNVTKKVGYGLAVTPGYLHQCHAATTKLCVSVVHVPDPGALTTVVTGVTANGVALTEISAANSPNNLTVKASVWRLDSPPLTGPVTIIVTFGATVASFHVDIFDVIGATVDEAEAFATTTGTLEISQSVAAASNKLVFAAYGKNSHSDGRRFFPAGSTTRWTHGSPYNGSWTSELASMSYGWTKRGAGTVPMKIVEEIGRTQRKVIQVVVFAP
jgi:hypothetical protein